MISTSSEQSARPLVDGTDRLAALIKLPHDWDSYGGVAPSNVAVANAVALLLDLWTAGLLSPDIHVDIVPVPTGGIQLEWNGPGGEIEIEIDRFGTMSSLIDPNNGSSDSSREARSLSLADIRDQVRRVVS